MGLFYHLSDVPHGTKGNLFLTAESKNLFFIVLNEPCFDQGIQLISIFSSHHAAVFKPGIPRPIRIAHNFKKSLPLKALNGHQTHKAIFAGEYTIGIDAMGTMPSPHPALALKHIAMN